MLINREEILLGLALVIIFRIFLFGKIKCFLSKKHKWNNQVLWRECGSCGKTQYLDMRNSKYVDKR